MSAVAASAQPALRLAAPTDARRWLQLGLAALWFIAGLLQAQSYMFGTGFAKDELADAAKGNPAWIADSIRWAAGLVHQQPVAWNTAFFLVQLALGLGIAFRPTLRIALAASIPWALVVWWFGEGFGGLFTGSASPLSGAPGGVLLYALLAVLLWPLGSARRDGTSAGPGSGAGPGTGTVTPNFVAARPVGALAAKLIWLVLWLGLAALGLQPANLAADGLHDQVAGMGDGQPGWVAGIVNSCADLADHNGTGLTIVGSVLLALIAVGGVLGGSVGDTARRVAVIVALVASAFIWLVGQGLGGVFGGQATDLQSGPLLALVALAYWPLGAASAPASAATAPASAAAPAASDSGELTP